ncbi:unnamed protein product, partial [Chrysoparadoxa australica]
AATPRPESQPEVDTAPSQPADDEPVARVEPEARTDGQQAGDSDAEAAADGPRRIGPVLANQTLWSLASNNRPAGSVTMDQMLVALYRSNPQAFDGNMNLMLKGATLLVPSLEDIRAISRREATQLVAEQRRAFEQLGGSSSQTRLADSGGQTSSGGGAGELRLEAADESAGDDASATRAADEPADGDMVAGLDTGTDDASGGEAASATDRRNETGADGNAEAGATMANAEPGNGTTGNAAAGADDGSESDPSAPITPVESVVPDSAAGLFTARQLLLALAGLLLVVALFAYLRRRQYKPMPADFS